MTTASGLREFESQMIESFNTLSVVPRFPSMYGGRAMPRTGVWIREHLREVGADYGYRMWKRFRTFYRFAQAEGALYPSTSYQSFEQYLYLLRRSGLIRYSAVPAGETIRGFERAMYELVPEMLEHPLWGNVYRQFDSWQRAAAKGFGPRKRKARRPGQARIKVEAPQASQPRRAASRQAVTGARAEALENLRARLRRDASAASVSGNTQDIFRQVYNEGMDLLRTLGRESSRSFPNLVRAISDQGDCLRNFEQRNIPFAQRERFLSSCRAAARNLASAIPGRF